MCCKKGSPLGSAHTYTPLMNKGAAETFCTRHRLNELDAMKVECMWERRENLHLSSSLRTKSFVTARAPFIWILLYTTFNEVLCFQLDSETNGVPFPLALVCEICWIKKVNVTRSLNERELSADSWCSLECEVLTEIARRRTERETINASCDCAMEL